MNIIIFLVFLILVASALFLLFVPKSIQRKLRSQGAKDDFRDIADLETQYGTPLDIIEINPARGREVQGALLVYDTFIVANGKRIDKADISDITFNNANIPQLENSYQIVLILRKGPEQYLHLSTGMDLRWSRETLLRVNEALRA